MTSREEFLAEHHRIISTYPEFTTGLDEFLNHPVKTKKHRSKLESAASALSPHQLHFVLSKLVEVNDHVRGHTLVAAALVASDRKVSGTIAEVFHARRSAAHYQIVGQEALFGFATAEDPEAP